MLDIVDKERLHLETRSSADFVQEAILGILQENWGSRDPQELSEEKRRGRGETYYRLGKIYYDKSDLKLAKAHFERALRFCCESKDFYFEFKVLGFLIRMASELMDYQASEHYIQRSDSITERVTSELGTLDAEFFYNAGVVKTYYGKFEEAFQNFELAVSKSQSENEPEITAKSYYSLATGHYQVKGFEQALHYLGRSSELLKVLDKAYLRGTTGLLYGNIYSELGDYKTANHYYQQANTQLTGRAACWNLHGYILLGRGTLLKKMGKYSESLWYFQMAQESIDPQQFKRLHQLIQSEISNVNDSSVDIYLDRKNRMAKEKVLGTIDFKHRFVLLEILFLLAKKPGIYYDKDELTSRIWGDEYNPLIHDKLIYTSISRLRKLIEPREKKRKYIIRGKDGYAFNPDVNARLNEGSDLRPLGNIDMSSPV